MLRGVRTFREDIPFSGLFIKGLRPRGRGLNACMKDMHLQNECDPQRANLLIVSLPQERQATQAPILVV